MEPQVTLITDYLTTGDLCKSFKRSPLTILKWRQNKGLPYVEIPGDDRPAIRYDRQAVKRWAIHQGLRMIVPNRRRSDVEEKRGGLYRRKLRAS